MAGGGPTSQDPDFTAIVLDQTDHIGIGSGLASDFELCQASGFLQDQINNAGDINVIASGVFDLFRLDLPLNADDDDVNHTTIFDIPVAEVDPGQGSRWNLKTPIGPVSGLEFDMSWFSEKTDTGEVSFNVILRQLPSGQDVSSATAVTGVMAFTKDFVENILEINSIKLNVNVPDTQDLSIELLRNSDTLDGKARVVSYSVRFISLEV